MLFPGGGGESRGRRLTDAGIRTGRCPDFCGAWQAVRTTFTGLVTSRGFKASSRHKPIDRGRKALFPETRAAAAEGAFPEEAYLTTLFDSDPATERRWTFLAH